MENQLTLTQQLENFENGLYDNTDRDTQIDAGWYDWFCKDSSLPAKTQRLYKRVKAIKDSEKFNNDATYVFFKNNSPAFGTLYDDFRICDIETGNVIYTVTPKCGHKNSNGGHIWGAENNFKEPLFEGKWVDIKKWFLNKL